MEKRVYEESEKHLNKWFLYTYWVFSLLILAAAKKPSRANASQKRVPMVIATGGDNAMFASGLFEVDFLCLIYM